MFRAPDLCSRHRDFKHLHHLRVRQWGNCCLFPETILRSQNCSWRNLTSQGGGGYFQVCWTLCFPAKWLASRGRIKNVSPKPPTRSKDRVFLQCSKCGFVGLESHLSQFVIPSPSLTSFSPLHTPGLSPRGFLCCSGLSTFPTQPPPASTAAQNPQTAWAGRVWDKITFVVISNLPSPYQERNWMQWFGNPRKISRIKGFPLHWMGPFPILGCCVWVESPAEGDTSRGHQIMSELTAQFLKYICAEVASCAVLWPLALSYFGWRYNQANLLPTLGAFTLFIYKYSHKCYKNLHKYYKIFIYLHPGKHWKPI